MLNQSVWFCSQLCVRTSPPTRRIARPLAARPVTGGSDCCRSPGHVALLLGTFHPACAIHRAMPISRLLAAAAIGGARRWSSPSTYACSGSASHAVPAASRPSLDRKDAIRFFGQNEPIFLSLSKNFNPLHPEIGWSHVIQNLCGLFSPEARLTSGEPLATGSYAIIIATKSGIVG